MSRSYRLAAFLLALLVFAGCNSRKNGTEKQEPAPLVVRGVILETVTSAPVAETMEVSGTVKARTSAVVSARIPGSIAELRVREGERVRKGQLLARLDAVENAANAAGAAAGIEEARQALNEASSRKKLADITFERYHNLFAEQAVTRQEFDVKKASRNWHPRGLTVPRPGCARPARGRGPPPPWPATPGSTHRSQGLSPANRPIWEQASFRASRS